MAEENDCTQNQDPELLAELSVKKTLREFNKHYLHFVQEEENRCMSSDKPSKDQKNGKNVGNKASKKRKRKTIVKEMPVEGGKRSSKRPDLKAITKMKDLNTVLYSEKRIGHLPGIAVGQRFYSRAEMVAVGLHHHWLNGIDCMSKTYQTKEEYKEYAFPLAVSIVASGQYEEDLDNSNTIMYTGQGGHDLLGSKRQIADQKMERGNLGLKNSIIHKVPVRVIRGHDCDKTVSYTGKVYTYDGLYKAVDYKPVKGSAGFNVFRFELTRLDGQPALTTAQVQFARAKAPTSASETPGLVCEDICNGQENFRIPATNVVDNPPNPPSGFVYSKSLQVDSRIVLPAPVFGCGCKGSCVDARICACAKLNGSDFPYVQKDGGRLIEAKTVVFECGPNCSCGAACVNRVSQQGLKYRLEVFKTASKGWAVRSWDTIPSGAPVCEYTGKLMRTDDIRTESDNNYIFEIDCLQTMNGLDGREKRRGDVAIAVNANKDDLDSPEYCIDACSIGNVARFINHSCQPNLFVQCILSSHHDVKLAKVMLFAADNIPPLQELTYDYGYTLDSVIGPDGELKQMPCHCGAIDCRKRLY